MRAACVASLLGLLQCGRTSVATAPAPVITAPVASVGAGPPPSIVPAASPYPEPAWKAVIAWVVESKPGGDRVLRSDWIERGPSGPVVRATRAEPVAATPAQLFALRESARTSLKICTGCARCEPDATGSCQENDQSASLPVAVPLLGGARDEQRLAEGPYATCRSSFAHDTSFDGVLGPFVFFRETTQEMQCGSRLPYAVVTAAMDDLAAPGRFSRSVPLDTCTTPACTTARSVLMKKAHEQLVATDCLSPFGDGTEVPAYRDTHYAYDKSGRLRGVHVFTMTGTLVCGFVVPTEVVDESDLVPLPDTLAPWARLPEWLVPYLHRRELVGVSPLPDGIDLAPWLAAFAAPIR